MFENHFEFEAIGTKWVLDFGTSIKDSKVNLIFDQIKNRVEDFEAKYSRFREGSLVSEMALSPSLYQLQADAKGMFDLYFDLYNLTDGLFTPLMGQSLEDAGYDSSYSLRPKEVISPPPKLHDVAVYRFPELITKEKLKMDFGACGKGHIIDLVGKIFNDHFVADYCIDAGGDLLFKTSSQKALRIGLEDPTNSEKAIGVCELITGSLCGSAGNRRNWGKYNHIINPKTVLSPENILATWVFAEKAILADAIATCLFFVSPELLKEKYSFEEVILYSDFTISKSENFPGTLFGV